MTAKDLLTAKWASECSYISKVTELGGKVKAMNNSLATFLRYCEVQKAAAERQGCYDSVVYIQHCIDDLT